MPTLGRAAAVSLCVLASEACATGVPSRSDVGAAVPSVGDSVPSPDLQPRVVFYPRVGNLADDPWGAAGPGVVLMNDAVGPTAAYAWIHQTVDASRIAGDVLVLCTHCGDVYSEAIYQLAPFNSVQTVLVPPQSTALDLEPVADRLNRVEVVLVADGDAAAYASWAGSSMVAAVQGVYGRGGVVVGAATGATTLGWAMRTTGADSATALADPYAPSIALAAGPFALAAMAGTYVDLDLQSSDRFGVLAAMTARAVREGLADTKASAALGIGLDTHAALAFDRNGNATMLGDDAAPGLAWILQGAGAGQVAQGEPLVWSDAVVSRFDGLGESMKPGAGCGTAFTYGVSIDGAAPSPYVPANPYEAAGTATACP